MRIENEHTYDGFEHLLGSLFLRSDDLMAMLTVYSDASGSAPDREIIVVGGFISTVEQWTQFNKTWGEKVLAKGPVEVYHATDLEKGWGEFKRWRRGRRDKFRSLAYKTLKPFVAAGISSALIKRDYESLNLRWHKIPQGKPANHFFFCVNDFIANVSDWAIEHGYTSHPINYVLERGDPGKGEVEKTFLELAADPNFERRHLIGSVSFLPKSCPQDAERHQRLRPLQAADIWAYETYQLMRDVVVPSEGVWSPSWEKRVRPDFRSLFKQEWRPYNRYWDKTNLPIFAERAKTLGMAG